MRGPGEINERCRMDEDHGRRLWTGIDEAWGRDIGKERVKWEESNDSPWILESG